MKYIKINKQDLEHMKLIYPNYSFRRINFSNIYYDYFDTVYKVLLNDTILSDSDIKELNSLNELKIDGLIKPNDIINLDGLNVGFTMDYFNGKTFDNIPKEYIKKLNILKKAEKILKEIHKNNIIVGDLHGGNILYNNKNEVKFCDIDGMLTTPFQNKRMNNLERDYFEIFNVIDKNCDIYLFNILTLAILLDRNPFESDWILNIRFGNFELDKIISSINSFKINDYFSKYIVDFFPENEKEFKKLTKKIR